MAWRTCQHGPDDIDCMYLIFPEGLINHPSLRRVLARILLVDLLLTQQHQKRQFINREIQNVIDEALVELELDEDWCKRVMEDFGDFPSKNFFSNLMPYVKRCNQPLYHRPLR
jgi:hypothetical protein